MLVRFVVILWFFPLSVRVGVQCIVSRMYRMVYKVEHLEDPGVKVLKAHKIPYKAPTVALCSSPCGMLSRKRKIIQPSRSFYVQAKIYLP